MKPTYEDVAALYVATFDRAPDQAGLEYWLNSGLSLEEISQSFFDQPETQELYGDDTSTEDFVTNVYNNVLDRSPDDAGLQYWVNELESGNIDDSTFILAIVNAAKEHPEDAQTLETKTNIGLSFANAGLNDIDLAKEVIDMVEGDSVYTGTNLSGNSGKPDWAGSGTGNPDGTQQDGSGASQDHGHNAGANSALNLINAVSDQNLELTPEEIDSLKFMYQEEKLAGDVYEALNDMYDVQVFANIAQAEDRHEASVEDLLVNAGVDISDLQALDVGEFQNEELQSLYDTLMEQGSQSLEDALNVGVAIDETDIADLENYLQDDTLNPSIKVVYQYLDDGSYNHLEAFNNTLESLIGTVTTTTDDGDLATA